MALFVAPPEPNTTVEARWNQLHWAREETLERRRLHALYTIPKLFPPENHFDTQPLPLVYSSYPANLVKGLGSQMTNGVFPTSQVPFFQLASKNIPDQLRQRFAGAAQDVERLIVDRLRSSNYRTVLHEAMLHLIVLADAVLYQGEDYNFRLYRVDRFVLRRDAEGRIAEMIVQDWLATDLLEPELARLNGGKPTAPTQSYGATGNLEPHYTRLLWNRNTESWDVTKEFRGNVYESDVSYKNPPYYHIGWSRVSTEDYSRSLVEENFEDIAALQRLEQAFVEGAEAGSRFKVLVNPTGLTKTEDIMAGANGDVVPGRQDDVTTLTVDVGRHLTAAGLKIQSLKQELSDAFLASQATRLRGERVTATQVEMAMREVSENLGEVFAQVASSLQRGVVLYSMDLETERGTLPPEWQQLVSTGSVTIEVKTGLDAIGRQQEGQRLRAVLEDFTRLPPQIQEQAVSALRGGDVLRALFRTAGLDPDEYVLSEQEIAEAQAQQASAQIQQQVAQQAIQSGGRIVEQQAVTA